MTVAAPSAGPRLHRQQVHGATLLTLEDHSLPLVRTFVALRGGALADPPGGAGLNQVMLDLLLRGTELRCRQEFNATLEQLGSTLQAVTGATASVLRGVCLRRNLDATLELVAEALLRPALDAAEMSSLVDEIVESLRAERDDDDTLSEIFLRRALYAGHPLGRSPQGEIPELQCLEPAAIRAAHAERVRAPAAIVMLAGDVTPDEARSAVEPLLAGMPRDAPPTVEIPPVGAPTGLHITVVDKPERTQSPLRLACPVVDGNHPDAFAFWVGTVAFGGTFTAPFCREVRDVRGWSYTAHADFDRRGLHTQPIVLRSAPSTDDLVDC
ncbi:MAG: pitrilysin family protein, partial [Myxococcota bacterium]